ncbi:MarR family winged helix-turn-helix transcriptional regulator [Kutzneria sp. 744]|uniref:MarR family winged helix-turn-helix transcriptional regulator n=1 Tax=Kutzneria sp. (strain 744) TaxID=345341 RepID=UPI001E4D5EF8|nr:MarR family transcriptional regulator [Kutzneria sp. 744]
MRQLLERHMGEAGGERRRPTGDELRIWRNFIETAERLRTRMARRMQRESILSPADYQVLLALHEADGQRLRSSVLAEVCDWERSRLSHHLRRMESKDLVTREGNAKDLRAAEIVLTETGAAELRRGAAPHLQAISELFVDALTADELASVETLTAALRRHLDTAGD